MLDRLTGFALVPVEVPSRDVALALALYLATVGRRVHFVADDAQWRILTAAIVAEPPGQGGLVMVTEPRQMDIRERAALRLLNQRRDTLAERLGTSLLWCGTADFLRATGELAPDFWSIREMTLPITVPSGLAGSLDLPNFTLPEGGFGSFTGSVYSQMDSPEAHALRDALFLEAVPDELHTCARMLLGGASSGQIDERTAVRMVEILRGGGDRRDLARALEIAGAASVTRNHKDAAEACLREAHGLFEQLGDRAGKTRSARALGALLRRSNRDTEAEGWLVEALDLAREIDDWSEEATSARELAYLRFLSGDGARARALLDVAFRRHAQVRDDIGLGSTHLLASAMLIKAANLEGAQREATEAIRLFEEAEALGAQGHALRFLAIVEMLRGHAQAALAALQHAGDLLLQTEDIVGLEACIQIAHSLRLPAEIATERDAFIAATEARIAALRAGATSSAPPGAPVATSSSR